jgi:RNA polymerase sigma-70 factor, ECF subfamily
VCIACPERLALDLDGSFETLVVHHKDLVYGLARRMTPQPADAEEVTQDVFLRAYRALQRYQPERRRELRLRGWLARITINVARNRARDAPATAVGLDGVADPPTDHERGPERIVERKESAAMWSRLLAGLPGRYRAAVGLRHVDGLSYPELAEALARPLGTVKSDVHRGVRLLRAAYESEVLR